MAGRTLTVRERSARAGDTSRPYADATPAAGGQQDGPHTNLLAQRSTHAGSAATGAQQHEAARIAPTLGHVHARGAGHVLGNDVMDAPGHAGHVARQLLARAAEARRRRAPR